MYTPSESRLFGCLVLCSLIAKIAAIAAFPVDDMANFLVSFCVYSRCIISGIARPLCDVYGLRSSRFKYTCGILRRVASVGCEDCGVFIIKSNLGWC